MVSLLLPSTYLCLYAVCYSLVCFRSSNLAFSRPLLELFIPLSFVVFPCSSLAQREHAQNVIGWLSAGLRHEQVASHGTVKLVSVAHMRKLIRAFLFLFGDINFPFVCV